ncbi:hypothetical protein B0J12DRAFT_691058 [Macrophomina phaseolina]|uniref:Flavin-containing monooxygenase-like protein n=1 Tax=Macrophomina phaseolina TaxID=35725 RepID=A0ABQ8FT39_9PEZI|nr:hypothetical protein B0J12DRAFT_691058 [Macrophomina phaseolina]
MASSITGHQTPSVPLSSLSAALPRDPVPEDCDHEAVARTAVKWLSNLDTTCLAEGAQWRDLLAFTGNMRTFSNPHAIELAWKELTATHNPQEFSLIAGSCDVSACWIDARFEFTLPQSKHPKRACSGIVRVVPVGNDWKIWILATLLEQVEGWGNVDVMKRLTPEQSKAARARVGIDSGKTCFDCAVIGGGPSGLSTAARLKALGVSDCVILDRNPEIGGNWLARYKSFTLHTSKTHSEMPFGNVFLPDDPYFLTSERVAAGYKRLVEWYGINIWVSTVVHNASWVEETQTWTLEVEYVGVQGNVARRLQIRARHLVFALGGGGQVPKIPLYANRDLYKGEVLHSVNYKSANHWKGKRGVIIGTGNSAHDLSMDMVDAGAASVTLVQRNRTEMLPLSLYKSAFDPFYHEQTDIALMDKMRACIPLNVARVATLEAVRKEVDKMPEYYDALERAGFRTERYIDLVAMVFERLGGHFFDVGAAAKIVDGTIKVEHATVSSFTETGIRFSDGRTLDADVVVFATGFECNMRHAAARIVGEEMGQRLEDFMGVDREGEPLGLCKPMAGQKNVWYIGAGIELSRGYSRFLALQIKADLQGASFDVYI